MSPGHDRTTVIINQKELWLATQDQISQHSSMENGSDSRVLPIADEILITDGF